MGNTQSADKNQDAASQPSQEAQQAQQPQHDRPVRRDDKNPFPVQTHRVAAPPEPSLTQAQGTTTSSSAAGQPPASWANPLHHHLPSLSSGGSTPSPVPTASTSSSSSARPIEVHSQHSHSHQQQAEHGAGPGPFHEPAKLVAVPNSHISPSSPRVPRSEDPYEASSVVMPHSSLQDVSYLTRPPRLPLPIEEEVHTPGSPIIAPSDSRPGASLEVEALESTAELERPTSTLSDTSVLEDDNEELMVDKTRPTVPTRLEWRHGGDKVYVTGTIFQWNRKSRLHPVEGRPGVFATTINVIPGTHHIRFLVDGQMCTSPDLPTTVDFANNLVNYIEVNPDDVPAAQTSEQQGAASNQDASSKQAPAQVLLPAPAAEEKKAKVVKEREVPPPEKFARKIPRYLLDLDQPEDSPLYQHAVMATEKLPQPPALPSFLNKPILNASSILKDDNSVLIMPPNHTVLNHLATSSIKNNVLAVSATTRYKSKYVTTIMYKPTTSEGI